MVMHWKYRIATLLIKLAPGIVAIPGAMAVGDGEDTAGAFTAVKEPVKFKGYRITANPAEYLLLHASLEDTGAQGIRKPAKKEEAAEYRPPMRIDSGNDTRLIAKQPDSPCTGNGCLSILLVRH